jgi:hypothetical protein
MGMATRSTTSWYEVMVTTGLVFQFQTGRNGAEKMVTDGEGQSDF